MECPDEDGFGGAICYEWWLLNQKLRPIPGVSMLHSCSRFDKEKLMVAVWQERRRIAAAAVRKREKMEKKNFF